MQPRLVSLALALALLAASPYAGAQEPTVSYRLRIEAPRELRRMLDEGLPLVRWQSDEQMTEDLLERLVAEAQVDAREAVATRGYFAAKVSVSIDRSTTPWTVLLRVDPGKAARVSSASVGFSGPASTDPEAASLLERIRAQWKLAPGDRFTQEGWDEAKSSAVRLLAGWRYAAARVAHSRARVDPDTGEAALQVELDSGPPFRFGAVEVRGVKRYPRRLVADLSPAQPGELYDREELRLYERRLLATGYFVSAQAGIVADAARAAAAPVRVSVIEAKSQQVETGLSFNTDVGPRLEARYANHDLFDTAWRFKSELQLDSSIRQGRLDLDAPPRAGGIWRSGFAQARESVIQNEDNTEYSAGIAHNWGLGAEPSALYLSVHQEDQRVSGELVDQRHAVFFGYRTQFRRTDDWESPRRGYIVDVSVGGAPEALSSQQFTRATARAMLFFPLGANDLLLRGEAGGVLAPTRLGIPSSFLFRTGGDRTVRGYAFESLGVREGDAVVGGRYLALASAEYTWWLRENWGIAGFVDAGNAWDSGRFDPAVGYGVGARFRTPIGPVRADLAYGVDERSLRLHFSVGFTF